MILLFNHSLDSSVMFLLYPNSYHDWIGAIWTAHGRRIGDQASRRYDERNESGRHFAWFLLLPNSVHRCVTTMVGSHPVKHRPTHIQGRSNPMPFYSSQ